MAGIDINRTTLGVTLDPVVSNEIWGLTVEQSAVMQAARKVPISGAGLKFDMLTGVGDAGWVNETDEKPVGEATFDNREIHAHTLALILPFSNQFRRDKAALYREIVRVLPLELGRKFDSTVFGAITKPGADFDQLNDAQLVSVDPASPFAGLLAARAAVGRPSHMISSPEFENVLLGGTYADGRPLFVQDMAQDLTIGRVMGAPVLATSGDMPGSATEGDTQAIIGDFAQNAMWGSVEGIQYSEADQATLTIAGQQVNLWQRNMFALRVEVELAFAVRNKAKFARLTNGVVDADTVTKGK